jgi:hypothetical protein
MADYTSRTVTTVTKEFTLPSPTNLAEVEKVIAAVDSELTPAQLGLDDTVTVRAHDDEIVFSYVVSNG